MQLFKKIFVSGITKLIISNEEINNIMRIIKSLEDAVSLITGVSGTNENEAREQKGGFLAIFFGTLGARLLGNLFTEKGVMRADEGTIRVSESTVRAG